MTDGESTLLRDGDTAVRVGFVRRGASTSVRLTDVGSGEAITLDATELESLARAPEGVLRDLLGR